MSADKKMVKKMMAKLPYMIQKSILERTPIVPLLDWVVGSMDGWQEDALHGRFEGICRSNNVAPTNGANTRWATQFSRFLKSLRTTNLNDEFGEEPQYGQMVMNPEPELYDPNDLVITGERLDLWANRPIELAEVPNTLEVTFEMTRPQRQRKGIRRRTMALSSGYAYGKPARFNYVLGNRHDLKIQKGEPMLKFSTTIQFGHPHANLAFDEDDHLYFVDYQTGVLTVFKKDLESPESPKEVFSLNESCDCCINMCVDNGRIFLDVLLIDPDDERMLYCYDTRTGRTYTTSDTSELDETYNMEAHGSCVVFRGEDDATIIYTIKEDGFETTKLDGFTRTRLNRRSYMRLVEGNRGRAKTYVFSFVDGQLFEHFLLECEEDCEFGRYTENVFYLMELNRRYVWFMENPGDKPHLLFADDAGTAHPGFKSSRRSH